MRRWMAAALAAALSACQTAPSTADRDAPTPAEQAAYQRCLDASQAVAMAWEMVEAQCRAEVTGEAVVLER